MQGLQVSAPFGKVPFALRVFEEVEDVNANPPVIESPAGEGTGAFPPPGEAVTVNG